MATDLTGGLDESREFVFAQQPDDPEMRESVNGPLSERPGVRLPDLSRTRTG